MRWICLSLILISFSLTAQQDRILKNLGAYKSHFSLKDSTLVNRLNRMAGDSSFTNPVRSQVFSGRAYEIAKIIEFEAGQCASLLVRATAKVYSNELDSALFYAKDAYRFAKKVSSYHWQIKALEMIGNVYSYRQENKLAIDYLLRATKLAEVHEQKALAVIYANMGHVFHVIHNKNKTIEYCNKSLKLAEKYKDTGALMTAYNLLGLTYKRSDTERSIGYYERGLEIARENQHIKRISEIAYNLSNVYFEKGETEKGFELFNESIEVTKNNDSYLSIGISYHAMSMNYFAIDEKKKAMQYADSALHYAMLSGHTELIMEAHALKANLYADLGDHYKALEYLSIAYEYKDSLNASEVNAAISDAEAAYESDKRELKHKLEKRHAKKVADEKIKSREILLWLAAFALLLFVLAAVILRKQNQKIKAKNIQVEEQKSEIELQHHEITESIRYAQRIQTSLLPDASNWGQLANNFSLFFEPRNVVSGDFYWAHCLTDKRTHFFAVADCTGHGVPGSLVSMLAISALNEVLNLDSTVDTGQMLNELRQRIISGLTKDDQTAKDGLDISLCKYDSLTKKLEFSGANNNLWVIRKEESGKHELMEFAGDRMPIGHYFKIEIPFTKHEIQLQEGDQLILYTDGFADQFGGERSKKYKYGRLKDFLLQFKNTRSHRITEEELRKEFETWKGKAEQTDDVCLLVLDV